jgi:bifunctional non-homologous end joining protein LigD
VGLSDYKKKRSFEKTPEPSGKTHVSSTPLRFVIQKHAASHLHYDFRLEMEGVLKSWAVPKGPSLNPADKRLAMMVEDHPYEYRTFEGIIPKGNYGAGTVIIWDEGTYEPVESTKKSKKEQEKILLSQLKKGHLSFILHGKKLNGEYALVHTKREDAENSWLLIKKQDEYASDTDVLKKDKSVVSNLSLERVAETSKNEWQSNRKSSTTKKTSPKKPATTEIEESNENDIDDLITKGKKAPFPSFARPMMASLVEEPFDDPDWIYEIKWDGYRALAFVKKEKVELLSRNNQSFNQKYSGVVDALKKLNLEAVLDGEIVVLNEDGNADFQLLQQWQKTHEGELAYYAFDILWLNGYDLTGLTILERKSILQNLIGPGDTVRYNDHIDGEGKAFFELAVKKGLEGIIAKDSSSQYHINVRSRQWLKIKTHRRQEAVIAGFTEGRGGRKHFGALVLGLYQDGEFVYIGHTGTGFDDTLLKQLSSKLKPLVTDKCPFKKKPKTNMPITWVKPVLVCEVKFQEWTKDNALRMPVFIGLREDKKPTEVKKEISIDVPEALEQAEEEQEQEEKAIEQEEKTVKKSAKKSAAAEKKSSEPAKKTSTAPKKTSTLKKETSVAEKIFDPKKKEQELVIDKQPITFTNLDKLYWKREKLTKADMLNYYYNIAPIMFPYMKDRPQSLNRHPNGIDGSSFYQKDVTGKVPSWIETYEYWSESDNKKKNFLVCKDEATLLYLANLGCIEMNPWHSRTQSADEPDWCVIDLDPGEISFEKVIETAQTVKQVLDELKLPSYCKTSGSEGLHIYVPMEAKYSYDQSRQLAELIVGFVHDLIPGFTSLERNPQKRKDKIYLDFLQNRSIQTIAAPYSLRPKPGATVSTPLHWDEVKKGLKISDFTIHNVYDRVKREGDLFKPVLGKGIDLKKALQQAEQYIKSLS